MTHMQDLGADRSFMKRKQRSKNAKKPNTSKRSQDAGVVDLSDPDTLAAHETAQRKKELLEIETKLESLRKRQRQLRVELGLGEETQSHSVAVADGSTLFFDEAADIFRDAPVARRVENPMDELEIDDHEFETRFETFVSADAGGDQKARNWLSKA